MLFMQAQIIIMCFVQNIQNSVLVNNVYQKVYHATISPCINMNNILFFFFCLVIVYAGAGARTPELKVTKETGYHFELLVVLINST